jgi:hypothetical protein
MRLGPFQIYTSMGPCCCVALSTHLRLSPNAQLKVKNMLTFISVKGDGFSFLKRFTYSMSLVGFPALSESYLQS